VTSLAPPLPAASGSASIDSSPYLSRPGTRERVLVFVTLFIYAWGTPIEWITFATQGGTESSAITQLVFLLLFGHTIISLNGNWHVAIAASRREPLLPAFMALALISTVWSILPATSFQDAVVIVITYVTALHLVVRFELREIVALLAIMFAASALLNLAFIGIFESFSTFELTTSDGTGAGFRGVTPNKNNLGRGAAIGYVTCAAHARLRRSWFVWPAFALVNAFLVLGTQSATSIGAVIGISVLSVVLLAFRGKKTLYGAAMVSMLAIFGVLFIFAATNLAATTGLLGKDSTFTGRLPIWQNSFEFAIGKRPIVGYGWQAFWQHGVADFDVQIRSNNFDVPHAHNVIVDALLQVGPLGAIILIALFTRALVWSTRYIRAVPTALGLFPSAVIALAVIYSSTEAGFISRSIQFIMLIVAITSAASQKGKPRSFADGIYRSEEADVPPSATAGM